MLTKGFLALLTALLLCLGAAGAAFAAEVDCDSVYCFRTEDFSGEAPVAGICVTGLPEDAAGRLMLGTRVLRPGDILAADQLDQLTFHPVATETDVAASLHYLPIYADTVASDTVLTISVRGREDLSPAAEDMAAETYKNLPLEGKLKVKDPEAQTMTFTVIRGPKRGEVTIREDGSFTYTPKKNKVGVDSFVYTATDAAGNVSREATVTVTILKPTDATQYTDIAGRPCRFTAEWMKNAGIFVGEQLDGNACFSPDKAVTRGEFVAMLVKTLELPGEDAALAQVYTDEIPLWLQPYLAAAVRSGLVAGLPEADAFGADKPVTGGEAAVMLQNALKLPAVSAMSAETSDATELALRLLAEQGIDLDREAALTREQTAQILYLTSRLAAEE